MICHSDRLTNLQKKVHNKKFRMTQRSRVHSTNYIQLLLNKEHREQINARFFAKYCTGEITEIMLLSFKG